MFFLLYAAKKYMVFKLKPICVAFIQQQLKPDNAITLFQHSIFFDEKHLQVGLTLNFQVVSLPLPSVIGGSKHLCSDGYIGIKMGRPIMV